MRLDDRQRARRATASRRRRGAALILVVVLGAVLVTIAGVVLQGSLLGARATTATWHHAGAHCTARSAIGAGCNALSAGDTGDTSGTTHGAWSAMSAPVADADGFADFSPDALFRALGDGYFESRVRAEGALYRIRGRGVHGGVLRTLEAQAAPRGVAAARPFRGGLFSEGPLVVNSNVLFDSFDSRLGTYAAHATTTVADGRQVKGQASNIGSNGSIEMHSNSRVFGDASPGVSGTLSLFGSSLVSGSTASLLEPAVNPPPSWSVPDPADPALRMSDLGVAYGGAFASAAGTTTLGPGRYVVSSLHLDGSATLRLTGSPGDVLELFITGGAGASDDPSLWLDSNAALVIDPGVTVHVFSAGKLRTSSNAAVNAAGGAEQLVYVSSYASAGDSDLGVELGSNATMAGLVYAPRAAFVHDSNAELFGSVVAGWATVDSNAFFHYDEALAELALPSRLQPSWFVPLALHEVR